MTETVTKKTITGSLAALKRGEGVNWLGFVPPIEWKDSDKSLIVVTNAALEELRMNGFTRSYYESQEMPGKFTLTFYNPATKESIGVASVHGDNVQYGENGPLIKHGVNISKSELVEQLGKRDWDKNTYLALGIHNRNRLIAPKNDNVVIGNEAYLVHNSPEVAKKMGWDETNPTLSVYREGNQIKFAYQDYVTSIPADKVKTLRIGDAGASIDPKTITAKPMEIDLPKSIESGKIVSVQTAKGKRAELGLSESIQLAEANPKGTEMPVVPNNGAVRQI